MTYKIQITVDDDLNQMIQAGAKKMGLSVSSYARFVLLHAIPKQKSLIEQSMDDLANGRVETLTLEEFNRQLDLK